MRCFDVYSDQANKNYEANLANARTQAFTTLVVIQLVHSFCARSFYVSSLSVVLLSCVGKPCIFVVLCAGSGCAALLCPAHRVFLCCSSCFRTQNSMFTRDFFANRWMLFAFVLSFGLSVLGKLCACHRSLAIPNAIAWTGSKRRSWSSRLRSVCAEIV